MVRLVGVRKRYRGRGEVLCGIDLGLVPGTPAVVVGTNGAGKSTLLRIVAGCASPSAGRVSGRPSTVGFLPGRFPASQRMPVHAYLRHLAALHGAPRARAAHEAALVLDELGFTGDRDAPIDRLSAGNVQKVGLAQALGCGPELLVLDEPWSNLDTAAAAALDRRLAHEVDRGAVLLVADHSGRADGLPGAEVLHLSGGVLTPIARSGAGEPAGTGSGAAAAVVEHPVVEPAVVGHPVVEPAVVEPAVVEPAVVGHTVVELRCPGDPAEVLRALGPVSESSVRLGTLILRVPVGRGDALLAAALAHGCSVLGVQRETS